MGHKDRLQELAEIQEEVLENDCAPYPYEIVEELSLEKKHRKEKSDD